MRSFAKRTRRLMLVVVVFAILEWVSHQMPPVLFTDWLTKTKPEAVNDPGEVEDVFRVDIPDDYLSIRFFPGDSRPEDGMFFFDFYDRDRQLACNAPCGYKLELLAPRGLAGPIQSVEAVYGIEAPERLEKFAVVELATCSLARPGKGSFAFHVPRRTRPFVAQPVRHM
ncbi:hypothetical protein GGX14DRAFT_466597 [Mycena pura]|uniref:Uncharacterized protein n=1 Tax=Mycena pura TaxID=153505 RepID=A0AAD6V8W7_9AGAR|nr:hypothetical protein GGX14DRAFT_466597 [Mycena pura]